MGKVRELTGVKAQRQGVAAGQEAQERQGEPAPPGVHHGRE